MRFLLIQMLCELGGKKCITFIGFTGLLTFIFSSFYFYYWCYSVSVLSNQQSVLWKRSLKNIVAITLNISVRFEDLLVLSNRIHSNYQNNFFRVIMFFINDILFHFYSELHTIFNKESPLNKKLIEVFVYISN